MPPPDDTTEHDSRDPAAPIVNPRDHRQVPGVTGSTPPGWPREVADEYEQFVAWRQNRQAEGERRHGWGRRAGDSELADAPMRAADGVAIAVRKEIKRWGIRLITVLGSIPTIILIAALFGWDVIPSGTNQQRIKASVDTIKTAVREHTQRIDALEQISEELRFGNCLNVRRIEPNALSRECYQVLRRNGVDPDALPAVIRRP